MEYSRPGAPDTSLDRVVNRVGALALAIGDATATDVDTAALTALANFAHGRRIEELRAALGLSQPGAAHLVTRLEADGLAARAPDPADRRGVRVRLTRRGRAAARRVLVAREAAIRQLLGPVSPAERATLLAVADRALAGQTSSRARARSLCRLCDVEACGHPAACPVTRRADALDHGA